MKLTIIGAGIWARGLGSYADLRDSVLSGRLDLRNAEFAKPAPTAIAPRERRRAGLLINLAVEVAHQACAHACVDKSLVPSVFVSAMCDTDITNYMCRKLCQTDKLLSPTKFHNSVHNAASGYWSISAENRAPSSFVGGFDHSFGAGFFEATSQALSFDAPVLLVGYDIVTQFPFRDILAIEEHLACAFVIAPASRTARDTGLQVRCELEVSGRVEASMPTTSGVDTLAAGNPMGVALALMEAVTRMDEQSAASMSVAMPLSTAQGVRITLEPTQ